MKFRSMKMKNFMRYKGVNKIEFSCDRRKNVTVILGDNTTGKTTIAQAFRWVLYGAVMAERNKQQADYQLLNNDVLAQMDADSRAAVSVELVVEGEEKNYIIHREIEYVRLFPKMAAKESIKKLTMKISSGAVGSGWDGQEGVKQDQECLAEDAYVEVDERKVEEVINELFPRNLSHYFLFDGERWSDVTYNGVKESIKESVHILTGLSAYQAALFHLKEMGAYSVISKFKKKIAGGGSIYDNLEKERIKAEREIAKCAESIKNIDINIEHYKRKLQEIEQYLDENKNTEVLQGRFRQLGAVRNSQKERYITSYKMLVNEFSDKAYMLFARPMVEAALEMMKSIAVERRDIPYMRQASIDYIMKTGRCVCGTKLFEGSKELLCLIEQRNYLPPADIGSLLGEFERTAERWKNRSAGSAEEMRLMGQKVDDGIRDYEDTCNQIAALERKMDEQIDFAGKRRMAKSYRDEILKLDRQKGELKGRIESFQRQIGHIELDMKNQEAKCEENNKWRKRIDLAETVYQRMKQDFERKEQIIFQELNQEIQKNFEAMFNARDKKIQLTSQYEIQMLYRTKLGYREENNLSEGEKIARNFAFVVTIMDYGKRQKAEKEGREELESDMLPIVLDGPFSKLGDENIQLVAKVLPEVSEQVIIFMLKKDWRYTKLDDFAGAFYHIEKEPEQSYASIRRAGGI